MVKSNIPKDTPVTLRAATSQHVLRETAILQATSNISMVSSASGENQPFFETCDVPNWPTEPYLLLETTTVWGTIAGWASEILLTILPIATIILCIIAHLYDGKSVDLYPFGQQIIQATTIVLSSVSSISNYRV